MQPLQQRQAAAAPQTRRAAAAARPSLAPLLLHRRASAPPQRRAAPAPPAAGRGASGRRLKYAGVGQRVNGGEPLFVSVDPDCTDAWRLDRVVELLKEGAVRTGLSTAGFLSRTEPWRQPFHTHTPHTKHTKHTKHKPLGRHHPDRLAAGRRLRPREPRRRAQALRVHGPVP